MEKILIVDDDNKIRTMLKRTLQKNNFEVLEAPNGIESIMIVDKEQVDLVLMDVMMPELGGLSSLLGFRDLFKKTKVVLMTGKVREDSVELRRMADELGVLHVLFKPFKTAELLGVIEKALRAS